MKRLLLSLLLWGCSQPLSTAHACDDIAKATPESDCVSGMMWHEQRGVWMELGKVHANVIKLKVYDQLELQVDELTKANALYARETASLRSAISAQKVVLLNLQAQVELAVAAERGAREKLESEGRWYKSPLFWGITMFIAGAAIQHACCSGK